MLEPTTEGLATAAGDPQPVAPEPLQVDADLEDRITRLEQLVAALGLLLDRFQGGGPALSETAFDNLDDPAASRAVLSILVASTADARWDVLALRRALRDLGEDPDAALGDPSLPRLDRLANSARELKNRFEAFRASIGKGAPSRSANATAQLQQVAALSIRALLDISESMDGLRPGASSLDPATDAAPEKPAPVTPEPEPRRRPVAAAGLPAPAMLMQVIGRRRNRLVAEAAALAVVVIVVLGSIEGRDEAPGSLAGAGSSSVAPSATKLDVAVGSFAPSESVLLPPSSSPAPTDPGFAPTPRPTSAPPPPPRPTPRPTPAPAPTSNTAAAASRFDGRMSSAADSIDGLLGIVNDAVQGSDFTGAKAAAGDIVATAQTARSWLQSHPPKACYEAVQGSAMATLGDLIATAGDIAEHADATDGNAIHKDVANSHGEVSALRRDGNKAVSFCA